MENRLAHQIRKVLLSFLTLVGLATLPLNGISATINLRELEERAEIAVDDIWTQWSKENKLAVHNWRVSYDATINYYGKMEDKARVMALKEEFAMRWPERSYSVAPNSVQTKCEVTSRICDVSGRVYWEAKSKARDAKSVGVAGFEFRLKILNVGYNILDERGNVIANKVGKFDEDISSAGLTPNLLLPDQRIQNVASLKSSQIAKAVLFCFNEGKGRLSVQQMFDCSGFWVTPKTLLRCSLGTQCPVLPDTINGRASLKAIMEVEKIELSSTLTLRPQDLPAMPSFASIEECKASQKSQRDFEICAVNKAANPDLVSLASCMREAKTQADQAKCIGSGIKDDQLSTMTLCLNGKKPTAATVASCSLDPKVSETVKQIQDCGRNGEALGCLTSRLPAEQQAVMRCTNGSRSTREVTECLAATKPESKKVIAAMQCLEQQSSNRKSAANCIAKQVSGDAGKIVSCLNGGDKVAALGCAMGDRAEVKEALQLYECSTSQTSAVSVLEHCSASIGIDPKTQSTLSCVARANGEQSKLIACGAQVALPADAARYVGCAASSQGPTSFALCAASPQMNEEFRIAAECVVQSGGQPYAAGACAATRLTIRELAACFKGQVGKDCFGPNNTIVKTVNNAFNDVTKGPGKNNDVVKAIASIDEAVQRLNPEARKFVEKPLGGDNALIPKARDDALNATGISGTGRKVIENPLDPRKWF